MTTLMADLVADTRRMAYGSLPDTYNLIATTAVAGAASLTLSMDVAGISPGNIISSGLNVWFVKTVDTTTKIVEVMPGMDGAPQAAVTAGDLVRVSPRVTDHYLFETLSDVIRSLSAPGMLYKLGSWTDTVDASCQTYDVPVAAQSMTGLLGARVLMPGSTDQWYDIPAGAMRYQQDTQTIRLTANPPVTTIEFRYKGIFTTPTALTDNAVTTVGLTDTMLDIPPLGAVPTLLRTTESTRLQVKAQSDTRRAGEVPATSNLSAANAFNRDFIARVGQERLRLNSYNPWKMSRG